MEKQKSNPKTKPVGAGPVSAQNAITLVALVITIIILLILAGVTINLTIGNNGIFQTAQKAAKNYTDAQKDEKTILSNYEDYINEYSTGVTVEQVTDTNPGVLEGTGTEDVPYVINSIEDLVFFAYDVRNGNNYEGQLVTLGLSLDFNSNKSYVEPFRTDYGEYGYDGELKTLLTTGSGFIPIGTTGADDATKRLFGTFDGQENAIYNLYINFKSDEEGNKVGLFSNNSGTIRNLSLLNVDLYMSAQDGALGGIAGQNSKTGSINNCVVSGQIKNESTRGSCGGITCFCSGEIKNSGNIANIFLKVEAESTSSACGGIASMTASNQNGVVYSCYNLGNVSGVSPDILYVGGIVGCVGDNANTTNCYNIGSLKGEAKILRIGGIAGYNFGNVKYCYNTGNVEGNVIEEINIGAVVGKNFSTADIVNESYYKKNYSITGMGDRKDLENMAKTETEMKSESFINLLNVDNSGVWKRDINNINNGYPILSWQ